MAIYRNLEELGNNTLCENDTVILNGLEYRVCPNFLNCFAIVNNDKIFEDLSLDKYDFCTKNYGYDTDCGVWPESKYEDYRALTRVVKAIFEIIEKEDNKEAEFKVGDDVFIIPYNDCLVREIGIKHLEPEYFDLFGIVREISDTGNVLVETIKGSWWYSVKALKPIKDYEVKVTVPTFIRSDACCSSDKVCHIEPKSNKIKVSSEFKFTVNKPKKVFF